MSAMPFTASVTTPDGAVKTYDRYGDSRRFVIYGRDAVGLRKAEQPAVAEWCKTESGARAVLPDWQHYGGEWTILPVAYTDNRHR